MIHTPRYRSAETRQILNLSPQQLRSLEASALGDTETKRWRSRTPFELFRLMLAMELTAWGVEVAEASKIAHQFAFGHGEDVIWADEAAGSSLEETLCDALFGQTVIVYLEDGRWHGQVHWSDGEHSDVEDHIAGSALVIRLRPLARRLIQKISRRALGGSAHD
jgi:hypothetical protein